MISKKNQYLIIDWIMLCAFIAMFYSRQTDHSYFNILQLTFLIILSIHILQHFKHLKLSFKRIMHKDEKTPKQ